jgi:hypothetical protein
MKKRYSMTIRMGAAHWDATIHNPHTVFDFRDMERKDRSRWYGTFMASVRKMLRQGKR